MINEYDNHSSTDNRCCVHHSYKRICWSAILAGTLVGVGLSFLLSLFAMAIGITSFTLNNNGAFVLAIGGLIGIVIGTILVMLVSGYTAGYLGRLYCPRRNLGIVYGFCTWTLILSVSAITSAHMSNYITSYSHAVIHSSMNHHASNASTVQIESSPAAADNSQKVINITASAQSVLWSAIILFALFLLGAMASCIGACWAMTCKKLD